MPQMRHVDTILKDLCSFNPLEASSKTRLRHDCYMLLVGNLQDHAHLEILDKLVASQDEQIEEMSEGGSEFAVLNSEEMECILEHVKLNADAERLERQRESHFVYEDHFNPTLAEVVKRNASFEKLKTVCRKYETRKEENVEKAMAQHERRTQKSTPYFLERGLPTDEAQASAFAISFYTGTRSETLNRGASLIARQGNAQTIDADTKRELNEAAIILFYLVKALSHIPYYWGYVTRSCELTDDELALYAPGCVITWIQFSSSKKGSNVASGVFEHRNTFFQIFSLTGRPIQQFSNFPEEDEVLFLPHCTFIIFKHEVAFHGTQHTIYMRQVELGLSNWSVLWVDDRIFVKDWENKLHMEYAAAKALNLNVHFIPKSSTKSALSFLRSAFGQRLKNQDTFRIVTDMNRENERPIHNAGARLVKAIRQMGFKNKCLIFTSDKRKAEQTLQSELDSKEHQFVSVSSKTDDLQNFVNFDRTPTSAKRTNVENSNRSSKSGNSTYSSKLSAYIYIKLGKLNHVEF